MNISEIVKQIRSLEVLADDALNGNEYAEEVYALGKQLEVTAKNIMSKVKDEAFERLQDYEGKRTFLDFKLTTSQRASYDYKNCQAWQLAKDAETKEADARKQIEKEMQMMESSGQFEKTIITADGEQLILKPAVKSVSDVVTVSIKTSK